MFETIDFSKSQQYTLSIRLSADGFSFSIYNPLNEGSTSFFEQEADPSISLTANLKSCFRDLEFLSFPYKRINILVAGKRFTLVPMELFEDDQTELLFHHNHISQPNEVVLYNILKRQNTVNIFGMDKSAHTYLSERFPEATFYSQVSPLLEFFQTKSRLGNSRKMYVFARKGSMDLFCYDRGKVLFINTFDCKHTADQVYYLLYVWKQLEFDQRRDELHLSGVLSGKETLLTEVRSYVLQVFVMNPETNIDIQAILSCE